MSDKNAILVVEATEDSLDNVTEFIDKLLENLPYSPEARAKLDMATEEIFVNIASYAYASDTGQATIRGSVVEEPTCTLTLIFEDNGKKFNPLERETPNLSPAIRRRIVGGLGIFLARSMADEISYEYREEKNILCIKKNMTV